MIWAIAFIIFSAACAILAFARHPIFGLYLYLGSIYVHPPSRWWGYMVPDLRWSFTSAAIVILAVLLHRGRLSSRPVWLSNAPAVLLTMYATWMWIQTPWALDFETHVAGSVQYIKYLVAFWFIYRIVDTKEKLGDFLLAHSLGCALLGVYAQFTGRDGGRLDGVGGPGMDDANTLAMYLATGIVVCFGLVLTLRGWRRWLSLAILPVILNGFVLANSRGAFLGLVAGVLVLATCKAREHRGMFWSFVAVGLIGSAVIVDKAFVERMFTISDVTQQDNEDADMSARSRMVIYEAQVRMAADYPMGVGFRGTVVLSPQYLDTKWLTRLDGSSDAAGRSSHNTFMTTLVEQGVLGALMYIALVLWTLKSVLKIRRLSQQGLDPMLATLGGALCGAVLVVIVAGSATDYLMAEVQFWLYAGLVSMFLLADANLPAVRRVGAAAALGRFEAAGR